ncbi:MAG: hypothetical protein ACRDAI_05660 [Candidatus Rhabdochlamydia sp.]
MTLPTSNIYPLMTNMQSVNDLHTYLRDLVFALEDRDEQLADAINGDIRGNVFVQKQQWKPTLKRTNDPGAYLYTQQVGWVYRQGLFTDVWFDVIWIASKPATGNLYIELPYKVAISEGNPFVGIVQATQPDQPSLTINAIPNTFRGEIWPSKSDTTNITTGRLMGHVRYIGVADE